MGLRNRIRGSFLEAPLSKLIHSLFNVASYVIKRNYLVGCYRKLFPFEPELIKVFRAQDLKKGVMIDVGAAVGEFSLIAVRQASKVYAIEPHWERFKQLEKNTRNIQNIKPVHAFVSEKNGTVEVYESILRFSKNFNVLYEKESSFYAAENIDNTEKRRVSIPCTTLDDLIEEEDFSKLKGLKIDVEGGELDVICGAERVLRAVDFALIEMHFEEEDRRFQEIFGILQNRYGFTPYRLTKDNRFFLFRKR